MTATDTVDDWASEDAGAQLMSRILRGTPRRHDHNVDDRSYDYDIHMPDGSVIAMEITQDMVQERENQRGAIKKLSWRFDDLGRDWFVDLSDRARVNDLHLRLPCLLGQLEREGVTGLVVPRVAREKVENTRAFLLQQFRSLGVHACRSYEPEDNSAGSIYIDQSVDPASFDVDSAAAAVLRHVSEREDNARKLGLASSAAERHLLIWVDHAALDASVAMQVGERRGLLPDEVLDLPCDIDVVWLALAVANPIVWRLDHCGWRSHGRIVGSVEAFEV